MERSFEVAVRERLAAYLASTIELDDLKTWLVATTWERDHALALEGARTANEMKLMLAEHSGGVRTDAELREDLYRISQRLDAESDARMVS